MMGPILAPDHIFRLPSAVHIQEVVVDKAYKTPLATVHGNADIQFALGGRDHSSIHGRQRDDDHNSATGSIGSANIEQNLYKKNTVPLNPNHMTPNGQIEDLQVESI